MKFHRFPLCLCALLTLGTGIQTAHAAENEGEEAAIYPSHEITAEGAWCWFADPRALHYENAAGTINSSYVGYIDVHGNIKAMQYDFLKGEQTEVLIRSYFQPDDHDNPTFLVLPDERIMLFYSRHTDEPCFYYRISQKVGDITTLGPEYTIPTENNTTYPSPFILSDDPDHFYLCWRGINWHPTIAKFTLPDANGQVSEAWGPYQIVQSTGARPYAKYTSNGKDKIYLVYTTGHPDNESPNFVYFNYIDILSLQLKDITGQTLSTIADGPFQVNKQSSYVNSYPNTVVDNSSYRDWVWQVEIDSEGNPVIAMVRISEDKDSHDYYYAHWTGDEWVKTFLCNGGGPFHQTPNLEKCYSGGMAIDPENPRIIYCSAPVEGENGTVYELLRFTMDEENQVAAQEQVTKNSLKNNVRPYILPGSGSCPLRLAWMYGDYYDWIVSSTRPLGYPTAMHCDFEGFGSGEIDLENGLTTKEDFDQPTDEDGIKIQNGVLVSTPGTSYSLALPETETTFSISLSPYINPASYEGRILRIGELSYELNGTTLKPEVKSNEQTWASTNLLGNSDCWQEASRGTGGEWYEPTKLEYFNLTLTYQDGELRIYRNGLLDQTIATEITGKQLELGGFNGWIEDCRIYNRILTQQEIKALSDTTSTYSLDETLQNEAYLEQIDIPEKIVTDIILPTQTTSGAEIEWTSSDPSLITTTGLVVFPTLPTEVTLTASIGETSRTFVSSVLPRNIGNNLVLSYTFEPEDVTGDNDTGEYYLADQSGNGRNARICGSALIDGTLNLTGNTLTGFSTNGYLMAPDGVLQTLRSYTFLMKATPTHLNQAPRLYDFGCNSGNSVFGRASQLTAGIKYQNGTTRMIDSPQQLTTGEENWVAFTFDATSRTTSIYLNGNLTASGTTITTEAYQVSDGGSDNRNYIGRTQWWDSSVANDNADFCGTIDDFQVYDIALTLGEIQAIMIPTSISAADENTTQENFIKKSLFTADEAIRIESPWGDAEQTLYIFDTQGRLIASHQIVASESDVENPQKPGTYLLSLKKKDSGKAVSQKIIVL